MTAVAHTLDEMLAQGFTRRCAQEFLDVCEREHTSGLFDPDYLAWSHEHGFYAESAYAYGLDESNIERYLSDYDYCRLWPLNGWQRIWINDKLTLNMLLEDTDMACYLPEYYYYTDARGLLPLRGANYAEGIDGLLATLRDKGEFACKPCNGTEASGFHKLAYREGTYLIDGKPGSTDDVEAFVAANPNYVFTEFIYPSAQMAAINPLIHTIRMLVLNPTGTDPHTMAAYLRFGMESSSDGSAPNYTPPTTADICSYNVRIDPATGRFGDGKLAYANRVVDSPAHPATGTVAEGTIECWPEVLEMLRRISLKVGACEYLGYDACITDKGPRIMEINSHSGIKYLQLFNPIMDNETLASYYRGRLAALDALDEAGAARRNGIIR